MMGEINWRDNWDSVLQEAKKEDRRILLELYMDGCPHCSRLHSETHVDDQVVQAINEKYIPIKLEGRQNMDIVKKFNVTGAPTTLLFSPNGEEKHRFAGYFDPSDYLEQLKKDG